MAWPSTLEYQEAIQDLPGTVSDEELRAGELACNAFDEPDEGWLRMPGQFFVVPPS